MLLFYGRFNWCIIILLVALVSFTVIYNCKRISFWRTTLGTTKDNQAKIDCFIFQFNYGNFILILLFIFHDEEVKKVVFQIKTLSFAGFNILFALICFGISLLLLGGYFYIHHDEFKNQVIVNVFYLLVFTIIFKTTTLIWGFAIYFVFWHSIPSILEQLKFLYGSSNFSNFKSYFRAAFVYWIVSLVGVASLYLVFKDKEIFNALFFSFLAAITFPHALVIFKMFNKK